MNRAAILPCLLLVATASPEPQQSAFCRQFRQVYDEGYRGFRPWRSTYDKAMSTYVSRIKFPNARGCTISENEYRYQFNCAWNADSADEAVEMAAELSQSLNSCFGARSFHNPEYYGAGQRSDRFENLSSHGIFPPERSGKIFVTAVHTLARPIGTRVREISGYYTIFLRIEYPRRKGG